MLLKILVNKAKYITVKKYKLLVINRETKKRQTSLELI